MKSGDLTFRVAFDAPLATADGQGGVVRGWDEGQVECQAHIRYLRGGETVIAARLAGVQPAVVTIRNAEAARAIRHYWRMRDLRSGAIYALKTDPIPTDDRAFLEITATGGVSP